MEVSVYSDFADRTTGVFDRSSCGERVGSERWDEPGRENFTLCDEYDVPDLMADLLGDWSWKPWRYKPDPGHIFTDAEIEALYPWPRVRAERAQPRGFVRVLPTAGRPSDNNAGAALQDCRRVLTGRPEAAYKPSLMAAFSESTGARAQAKAGAKSAHIASQAVEFLPRCVK